MPLKFGAAATQVKSVAGERGDCRRSCQPPALLTEFRTPQLEPIVVLNGTGSLCVTSMTESILPAAPQYSL